MPTTTIAWLFFAFFAIGALGGWLIVISAVADWLVAFRVRRDIEAFLLEKEGKQ